MPSGSVVVECVQRSAFSYGERAGHDVVGLSCRPGWLLVEQWDAEKHRKISLVENRLTPSSDQWIVAYPQIAGR